MPATPLFDTERQGATMIVTPSTNLSEFQQMDQVSKDMVELLNDPAVKNLVIDFHKTDYFGSSAIVLFVKLWKLLTQRSGAMAFCNLSEHEQEILHIAKLDKSWSIHPSKEAALKAVGA